MLAQHWSALCVLAEVQPPFLHCCKQLQADHSSQSTASADALSDFRLDGATHSTPPSDPTSPGATLRAGDTAAAPDTASTVVYGDIEVPISPADSPVTHPQTDLHQHAISRVGDDLHELRPSPDPLQLSSPAPLNQIGGEEPVPQCMAEIYSMMVEQI